MSDKKHSVNASMDKPDKAEYVFAMVLHHRILPQPWFHCVCFQTEQEPTDYLAVLQFIPEVNSTHCSD